MGSVVLVGGNPAHGPKAIIAAARVGALHASWRMTSIVTASAVPVGWSGEQGVEAPMRSCGPAPSKLPLGVARLGSPIRFVANAVTAGRLAGDGVDIILGKLGRDDRARRPARPP